jgi:hypothetical protein
MAIGFDDQVLSFPPRPVFIGQRPAIAAPLQAFQAALAFHRQGLHDLAEPLYRRVLKRDRDHFDSLHMAEKQGLHSSFFSFHMPRRSW